MASPQPKQLFRAVKVGDVAKVRELLAAGVPVEATDENHRTAVMLAAEAGQAEAFRTLAEAGADLHALALDQLDLLECAAQGGDVRIIRFLIDRGLPIEGHWQPRSQSARRQGHVTPLMCAAVNGHEGAVRLLLQAGADRSAKFDGQTALQMVQAEIRFPGTPAHADRKQAYLEIAALLAGPPVPREAPQDAAARELEKFAENARQPTYGQFRQRLTELCGEGQPWCPAPDHGVAAVAVVCFRLRPEGGQRTLDDLQGEAESAGCQLVLASPWAPGESAELALFPTRDKFAIVTATGTEGADYGIQTADVVAWLAELDQENPFALRYCGHDLVGGSFRGSVKSAKKWAQRIAEVCPPVLDGGFETPEMLARVLSKGKTFLLRWD